MKLAEGQAPGNHRRDRARHKAQDQLGPPFILILQPIPHAHRATLCFYLPAMKGSNITDLPPGVWLFPQGNDVIGGAKHWPLLLAYCPLNSGNSQNNLSDKKSMPGINS